MKLLGLTQIPCTIDERKEYAAQLSENVQRADLTPMEIAESVSKLRDEGKTLAAIAKMIGITETRLGYFLSLFNMPPIVMKAWNAGIINDVRVVHEIIALLKTQTSLTSAFISKCEFDQLTITRSALAKFTMQIEADRQRNALREGQNDAAVAKYDSSDDDNTESNDDTSDHAEETTQESSKPPADDFNNNNHNSDEDDQVTFHSHSIDNDDDEHHFDLDHSHQREGQGGHTPSKDVKKTPVTSKAPKSDTLPNASDPFKINKPLLHVFYKKQLAHILLKKRPTMSKVWIWIEATEDVIEVECADITLISLTDEKDG